jgi:hypothetical protein
LNNKADASDLVVAALLIAVCSFWTIVLLITRSNIYDALFSVLIWLKIDAFDFLSYFSDLLENGLHEPFVKQEKISTTFALN